MFMKKFVKNLFILSIAFMAGHFTSFLKINSLVFIALLTVFGLANASAHEYHKDFYNKHIALLEYPCLILLGYMFGHNL